MKVTAASVTIANRDALDALRVIPPNKQGQPRGSCTSCGLFLWSEGGYRVSRLPGLFCSLLCVECVIAERTGQTKKIHGAPIGNGSRLLANLKTEAPQVYAKLANGAAKLNSKRCLECGVSLDDKRRDSRFCSDTHKKRFSRRSQTDRNRENSRDMPIGKQGLTNAQNGGPMDILTPAIDALEMAVFGSSHSAQRPGLTAGNRRACDSESR